MYTTSGTIVQLLAIYIYILSLLCGTADLQIFSYCTLGSMYRQSQHNQEYLNVIHYAQNILEVLRLAMQLLAILFICCTHIHNLKNSNETASYTLFLLCGTTDLQIVCYYTFGSMYQ